MKAGQIKVKFVKRRKNGKHWIFPKTYIFKLTPKDQKEFKELKVGDKIYAKFNNPFDEGMKKAVFLVEAIGNFDKKMRKPCMIKKILEEE